MASRRCRRSPGSDADAATEQPFAARDMPLTRDFGKTRLENFYAAGRKTKAIAIGPR